MYVKICYPLDSRSPYIVQKITAKNCLTNFINKNDNIKKSLLSSYVTEIHHFNAKLDGTGQNSVKYNANINSRQTFFPVTRRISLHILIFFPTGTLFSFGKQYQKQFTIYQISPKQNKKRLG